MLLIFDWDGTLADSEAHIVSALQRASEVHGLPVRERRACASLIGLGLAEAATRLHPQLQGDSVNRFCRTYSDCFRELEKQGHALRLFAGVEAMLEALLVAGHTLAVATGKSRRGLDRALANSGLEDLFTATRTADESASKPDPTMLIDLLDATGSEVRDAVMIGDTTYDMQMAQALGMSRVAATYGVHESRTLREFSPDWLIGNPAALLDWPRLNARNAKCSGRLN